MSVLLYWQERLQAQNPLYDERLRIPGYNVRPLAGLDPRASWPRAVARSALYEDYIVWHKQCFLDLYRGIAWSGPMPQHATELIFFTTIAQWIYIVGADRQVRTYAIPASLKFEDTWYSGKKNRYFIRLLDWRYHAAQFELTTGIFKFDIGEDIITAEDRIRLIEGAKANYMAVLDHNRGRMEQSMRGDAAAETT